MFDDYAKELNALHTEKNQKAALFRASVIDACNYKFKEVPKNNLNADSRFHIVDGISYSELMSKLL